MQSSLTGYLAPVQQLARRRPTLAWLFAGWLLLMINVPILNWVWGEEAMRAGVLWGVGAQAAVVIAALRLTWTWREIGRALLVVVVVTFSAEAIGTATGFPFGPYTYTDRLWPHLLHVPLLIPLAWFMMLPPSWVIAARFGRSRWAFAAVGALAITAWDLFLDPQMVAWGYWVWEHPHGYFGIPWSNYGGWLLTGFLLSYVAYPWVVRDGRLQIARLPLLLVYTLTWFLETVGLGLFWGMPGPAAVGAVVMGGFAVLGWLSGDSGEKM